LWFWIEPSDHGTIALVGAFKRIDTAANQHSAFLFVPGESKMKKVLSLIVVSVVVLASAAFAQDDKMAKKPAMGSKMSSKMSSKMGHMKMKGGKMGSMHSHMKSAKSHMAMKSHAMGKQHMMKKAAKMKKPMMKKDNMKMGG
jgi:hypothetical protein